MEIAIEVVDKQILRTVIDDGANINIMPASTMQKLGLAIIHPSLYSIRIADQTLVKPLGRIKDLTVKTGGVNYQVNFEVLPMKRSISTMLNEEAYPLLLGRGFLRQCVGVVDWSTKKPTFTYGPPSNRAQVLIEPKVERVGAKLGHGAATNPVRLLQASTSTDSATKTALHPRIKSFGPGLYDFADEDGTFAHWLIKNPYSDDESSSPKARAMKDSDPGANKANLGAAHLKLQHIGSEIGKAAEDIGLGAENIHESSTDSGSSTPMISNHSVLFVDEILARMDTQVPKLEEDQAQDASTSQTYEERPLLRQTYKPRIQKAARPKPASAEAAKSMKKLLKEAWEAKAKAKKAASKKLAPLEILSFDDWRAKKRGGDYSHQAEELSDDEVTNPTVMFARQMIIGETNPNLAEADEILAQDVSTSKINDLPIEERQLLRQKHKPMIYKAASPRKVTLKASKSISELLKEAWKIKTKVATQAKKCFKAVKKMSNLAPSSKTFLSFEDWQFKKT